MKLGFVYPQTELDGNARALHEIGIAVEALGYDCIAFYDHVAGAEHADREPPLTGPYTERDPFHDPLVALTYLAAVTERIELATSVLVLAQRQTVLVARQVADLDLSPPGELRFGPRGLVRPAPASGPGRVSVRWGPGGSLAVLTELTVRLHGLPEHVVAARIAFPDVESACRTAATKRR